MDRVIVYIDGFNLYFGLKSKGWRRYFWLNPQKLIENLLKPEQKLVFTKYFTARVSNNPRDPGKHKRQATFLEAIETLPDTRIYYGHYLPKPQTCFKCGATWNAHEEKMTDVNIAVEMLNDAYDDAFDTAMLVSADSDLSAPVEAVRARFPKKRVVVACPPDRQSKRLESVASACFRIGRKKFHDRSTHTMMARCPMIADTFTDSLARLTGDEQKAVKTTAFDLQLNQPNHGMVSKSLHLAEP